MSGKGGKGGKEREKIPVQGTSLQSVGRRDADDEERGEVVVVGEEEVEEEEDPA